MFNYLFNESYGESYSESLEVNAGSVGVFIINLDVATSRLDYVMKNISQLQLPVTRVSAVDGRRISQNELTAVADFERYKKYFKMDPEPGTVGCFLSHVKVWKEFLKSPCEFALVFEDDVTFDPQTLKKCVSAAVQQANYWDILSFEMLHRGNPVKVRSLDGDHSMCLYLTNVTHSGCYLVNRAAAKKLLSKCFPICMGLDHYFTASWEFDLKFLGVEPRIVHQTFGDSYIKADSTKKFSDFGIRMSNALYLAKRAIVHFAYNAYLLCLSRN